LDDDDDDGRWHGMGRRRGIGEVFDWATREGCPLAATRGAIASSLREQRNLPAVVMGATSKESKTKNSNISSFSHYCYFISLNFVFC
jgi:hypothetical protein